MSLKNIKLLVLDVDGVLTSGRKPYNSIGEVNYKEFNDKDFTAIKRFVEAGIPVVWLSGDKNINEVMAANRNIPFYYAKKDGRLSKKEFVPIFCNAYGCKESEICYVGDDYFDLDIIKELEVTYCPSNAVVEVKSNCLMLDTEGGCGVVAELFYRWVRETGYVTNDANLRDIDSKEK